LDVVREGGAPHAVTQAGEWRYADFVLDRQRKRLLAVREQHAQASVVNTLVAIDIDSGEQIVLAQGCDFYASPRLSPDGRQLAWISWNHPAMPWDGTELWLADVGADGRPENPRRIAGGTTEAVIQPAWSPDGRLYFVSDRTGWWNLYRCDGEKVTAVYPLQAEFGRPHWLFGVAMYGFASAGEIICTYIQNGTSYLARVDLAQQTLTRLPIAHTDIQDMQVGAGFIVIVAGSPTTPLEVVRIDLNTLACRVLASGIARLPEAGYLSIPESISYPSTGGRTAHAFFYWPSNRDCVGPPGEQPPLIVNVHGGPTSMATSTLKLGIQYWTSRGFAVLDVNYGGSSGFGRDYRDALKLEWGVVDVDDCVHGARYLVERGLVNRERLIIRGGSAGGFTTLCALAFHEVFKAGASYYGVSDLKALDDDSHKFESQYNASLTGPYPECEQTYLQRSPVHHAAKLGHPVIFFQGLDDKVVPPSQSEIMVEALRARGIPVAYIAFEGEGHGFRKAENIERSLEAELYFYGRVFGLALAEAIEPVAIANLQ
jgi:dipeptidyl aminopeptidase/acylaminoacyl peptidase